MSFTEKAKIVDGHSVRSTPESTGSKHQYELYLFPVAHSQNELSISLKNLGYQVKGPLTIKAKILYRNSLCIEVKERILTFDMILILSPQRVPGLSYLFPGKFGRSVKGSFIEKAKIVDRGSLSSAPESTGSKLQYEPHLFSVSCSQTELSISGKIWENR